MIRRLVVTLAVAVAALYWFVMRRWFSRWGTTAEELGRVMEGDSIIPNPTLSTTHAVTVEARAEHIWPWLVQMGYQRGGLYSYDWLDRLFGYLDRPSANIILPEFQHLAVGDKVPIGPRETLSVAALQPCRSLVLSHHSRGLTWVWEFGLYPIDEYRTRLVSRGIEYVANTLIAWLFLRVMEPAAFVMTRRMLIGLKKRAEMLRRQESRKLRAA